LILVVVAELWALVVFCDRVSVFGDSEIDCIAMVIVLWIQYENL
jgi:hypothetical protein